MKENKIKQLKKEVEDYLSVLQILSFKNSNKYDIDCVKHFLTLIDEIEQPPITNEMIDEIVKSV